MKTQVLIIALAALTIPVEAQTQEDQEIQAQYGVRINNFNTRSGFKMGSGPMGYIQYKGNVLEAGFFYDYEYNKISGLMVNHEIKAVQIKNHFEGYFFYSFIVRKTKLRSNDFTDPFFGKKYNNAPVMSMEHYFGLGANIKVTNSIFFDTALGYGLYLGSIKKANQPTKTSPVFVGKSGWGNIFRFGVGYSF